MEPKNKSEIIAIVKDFKGEVDKLLISQQDLLNKTYLLKGLVKK